METWMMIIAAIAGLVIVIVMIALKKRIRKLLSRIKKPKIKKREENSIPNQEKVPEYPMPEETIITVYDDFTTEKEEHKESSFSDSANSEPKEEKDVLQESETPVPEDLNGNLVEAASKMLEEKKEEVEEQKTDEIVMICNACGKERRTRKKADPKDYVCMWCIRDGKAPKEEAKPEPKKPQKNEEKRDENFKWDDYAEVVVEEEEEMVKRKCLKIKV